MLEHIFQPCPIERLDTEEGLMLVVGKRQTRKREREMKMTEPAMGRSKKLDAWYPLRRWHRREGERPPQSYDLAHS